ncbi:Exo-beta-1,3-glucanase, GH17 family [Polaribacter sp. KT25b]|uniref:glycoside hydrolase family 17 protein n=1 Tax=Polaribacter sp. KT25b TaxID=1855336 RepID=UPI00087D9388|nr:glycosyl hydrolase family 17 protein [Polaribacter sp. KT25b]SDR87499.1 Exo-beta-1,3-glucanase, GH17 family [Polaribacter sp. KT25b]
MSYRKENHISFEKVKVNFSKNIGVEFSQYSKEDIVKLWRETLDSGMHGICFSIYADSQKPGDFISEEQIERRINILKPYTKWIRSFSCTEGHEHIAKIAKKHGIKTLVGAWLSDDLEKNEEEIEGLIQLAKKGFVDIAAVGNEVLYRKELTEEELLVYINRVKEEISNIEVGYVDAYYEFSKRPAITAACDVILSNCYPFWEGCNIEYSLNHMQEMYEQAKKTAKGKRIIITETGWPSKGSSLEGAHSNAENAMKYFINSQVWAEVDNIEMFYFSSFDESWKVGDEGDVGAYWGLWDKYGNLKF